MKVVPKPEGAWLVEGDIVLSEVRREPGAANSLFDVLGAAVACLSPGERVAALGFAGGGFVGPLRALEGEHRIEGCDLDLRGAEVFQDLCGEWAGDVEVDEAEAAAWLEERRGPYDCILEDLSEPHPDWYVVKPWISFETLPRLMAERCGSRGVVIINWLPYPDASWKSLIARLAEPWGAAVVVHFDDYENRLVILGRRLPGAAAMGRKIRAALEELGSDQVDRIAFRSWRRPADS